MLGEGALEIDKNGERAKMDGNNCTWTLKSWK